VSDQIYQVENHYLRTALRAKDADYRALLEAVEWEIEARKVESRARDAAHGGQGALAWAIDNLAKARAEVSRLVGQK